MDYAIGIDSGTQGVKVVVVDWLGRVKGRGYAPHRMVEGLAAGASEQQPQVWAQAMESALAKALRTSRIKGSAVRCLGISGQQHGFVPLDRKSQPLRPAKLWNDTSTIAETAWLVERLGGTEKTIEKLGINLAVGFTASKILWLKNREPENFRRLHTVLLPHNYLNFVLTGRSHMEYGDASGTGLMDIRSRTWSQEMLNLIDPDLAAKLPELRHPAEAVGAVEKEMAGCFGWGEVWVASGGGDNMMAAIGTGNVRPGIMTLSLGTSGTLYSYFAEPFVDPLGEIAAFCDSSGGWLPLLCTMNVTNTTEMLKGLLHIGNEELERLAGQAEAGAGGLLFLPFIDGERVPVLPFASGVLFGLDRRTFSVPYLARAVLEGTVFNLGYGWARLRSLGLQPTQIRATGGGAKNRLWLQIVADIFQTPVVTLEEEEAGAYGAALQAIWNEHLRRGEKVSLADVTASRVRTGERPVEPDSRRASLYAELQERFNNLWRNLSPEFRRRHERLQA